MPFIIFSCLIALARTSSTIMNSEYSCLCPHLGWKVFSCCFFSLTSKYKLLIGFSLMPLNRLRKFPDICNLLWHFIMNEHCILPNFFVCWLFFSRAGAMTEMIIWFFLYAVNRVNYIISFQMLNQPYIPGIKTHLVMMHYPFYILLNLTC